MLNTWPNVQTLSDCGGSEMPTLEPHKTKFGPLLADYPVVPELCAVAEFHMRNVASAVAAKPRSMFTR